MLTFVPLLDICNKVKVKLRCEHNIFSENACIVYFTLEGHERHQFVM